MRTSAVQELTRDVVRRDDCPVDGWPRASSLQSLPSAARCDEGSLDVRLPSQTAWGRTWAEATNDGDASVWAVSPLPSARGTVQRVVRPAPEAQALIADFERGYRDFGGREEWLAHFINDVMPCEGGLLWYEFGDYSASGYISAAQFHYQSWATASAATGATNPRSAFDVGANVAWWSNNVSDPWGSGGWPVCGHRGGW